MNNADFNNDPDKEAKDYFFIGTQEEWDKQPDNVKNFLNENYTSRQLTLDNYQIWADSFYHDLEQKAYVFYGMPYKQFYEYIRTSSIELIPLGEFVKLKSKFKLKDEQAFRKSVFQIIPSVNQNKNGPAIYEDFESIFDSSLKQDINFELTFYFQIAKQKGFLI